MDERANAKKTQLGTYLTDLNKKEAGLQNDLATLQLKITQKSQFPSTGDKLKNFFSTKDHTPLAKLNKEARKLQDELATVAELKSVAEPARLQHRDGRPEKAPAPERSLNTVSTQTPP